MNRSAFSLGHRWRWPPRRIHRRHPVDRGRRWSRSRRAGGSKTVAPRNALAWHTREPRGDNRDRSAEHCAPRLRLWGRRFEVRYIRHAQDSPSLHFTDKDVRTDVSDSSASPTVLATVGYEGRSIDDFHQATCDAEIERSLVDAGKHRSSVQGRLSQRRLADALDAVGIEYRHERLLGNPKDNREAFRAGAPEARELSLASPQQRLAVLLRRRDQASPHDIAALLCFEREHDQCHRSCIADQAAFENAELRDQFPVL